MLGDIILAVIIPVLFALIALFASIQAFYLEGMRLRTRDSPSLQFFKTEFEPRLNLRSDVGALTYSLWKNTILVVTSILVLAKTVDGEPLRPTEIAQSIALAWIAMILCAYMIPQLLFR